MDLPRGLLFSLTVQLYNLILEAQDLQVVQLTRAEELVLRREGGHLGTKRIELSGQACDLCLKRGGVLMTYDQASLAEHLGRCFFLFQIKPEKVQIASK